MGRFYDSNRNFLYWYCDIIETEYDRRTDTYTINDLLLDIKIYRTEEWYCSTRMKWHRRWKKGSSAVNRLQGPEDAG